MNLNGNFLTIYFDVVEELHGVLRFLGPLKLNQRIALWLLRDMVPWNFDVFNCTYALKIFLDHLLVIDQALDTNLTVPFFLCCHATVE